MAILYHNNRQYPKFATAIITAVAGEGTQILLPPGSLILGDGGLTVTDAFAGSSPTITIQDNAGVPKGYIEAESLGALAYHPLEADVAGTYYPAGATLTISFGGTVTAGTGEAIFTFGYVIKTAENELYGRSA
jgi:hypothetical protein